MSDHITHSEPMAQFLYFARYGVAGILILLSTWVFITNLFVDFNDDEITAIHYLYTLIGYGLALLVLMLTPAGIKGSEE